MRQDDLCRLPGGCLPVQEHPGFWLVNTYTPNSSTELVRLVRANPLQHDNSSADLTACTMHVHQLPDSAGRLASVRQNVRVQGRSASLSLTATGLGSLACRACAPRSGTLR